MEFGSSKDGFVEEDQDNEDQVIIGDMGKKLKLPLSSASSASASSFSPSSSPSPSSSHYRYTSSGVHHHHQQQHQQQPSTTDDQQQQQQQHWRGSQIYHHQHPPGDSSSLRFHGGYYEGANNFSNSSSSNLLQKQHEFMDLSPRNHENMGLVAESDVAVGGSSGNNNADVICIEREHMFDKVVTPSDVGKLNRLVIPKQHAEKYFPLDSAANEKGLLLSFEDRSGKPWRFRYSYWNSSQSYVMTKGWSRFVKEKKLDAGDIVSFERGANESAKDRLFIDWRRRVNPPDHHHHLGSLPSLSFHNPLSYPRTVPWGRLLLPQNMTQSMSMPREQHLHLQQLNYYDHQRLASSSGNSSSYGYSMAANPNHPGAVFYLRSSAPQQGHHHGLVQQQGGEVPMVYDSVPVVHGKAAAKRVRLFGVNLDCPISEEDPDTTMAPSPSSFSPHHYHHHQQQQQQQQQLPPTPLPPHLQLRVYNGAPLPQPPTELPKRGRPSLSFDLDG